MSETPTPWFVVGLLGVAVGIIIGRWSDVSSLWRHREEISAIGQIAAGVDQLRGV
jgi:hypothetical protein